MRRRENIDKKWKSRSRQRAEKEMEHDLKLRKIRQNIAEKRLKKRSKIGALALHPFAQSASELGNRPVQIRRERSKTKSIKVSKSGKLISPKGHRKAKKKSKSKRRSHRSVKQRHKSGLTAAMLGSSYNEQDYQDEDLYHGETLSRDIEEALAEGEAWKERLQAQEKQHSRRNVEDNLETSGDLSDYEPQLQLSPLEHERNRMSQVVAPQLDRILGFDVAKRAVEFPQ